MTTTSGITVKELNIPPTEAPGVNGAKKLFIAVCGQNIGVCQRCMAQRNGGIAISADGMVAKPIVECTGPNAKNINMFARRHSVGTKVPFNTLALATISCSDGIPSKLTSSIEPVADGGTLCGLTLSER